MTPHLSKSPETIYRLGIRVTSMLFTKPASSLILSVIVLFTVKILSLPAQEINRNGVRVQSSNVVQIHRFNNELLRIHGDILAGNPNNPPPPPVVVPGAIGSQPTLVMLVNFQDNTS